LQRFGSGAEYRLKKKNPAATFFSVDKWRWWLTPLIYHASVMFLGPRMLWLTRTSSISAIDGKREIGQEMRDIVWTVVSITESEPGVLR
jgi:hypothetical protein